MITTNRHYCLFSNRKNTILLPQEWKQLLRPARTENIVKCRHKKPNNIQNSIISERFKLLFRPAGIFALSSDSPPSLQTSLTTNTLQSTVSSNNISAISSLTSTPFSPLHVQQQRPVASLNVPGVSETCLTDLKTNLGEKYYSFVVAW